MKLRTVFVIAGTLGAGTGFLATALFAFEGRLHLQPGRPGNRVELGSRSLTLIDDHGHETGLPQGWRVDRQIPDELSEKERLYFPHKARPGKEAVHLAGPSGQERWVELGAPARLVNGLTAFYGPEEKTLPFYFVLAEVHHGEPGQIRVLEDGKPARGIAGKMSLAGYELDAGARSVVVRHDPGRWLKLLGLALLAFPFAGTIRTSAVRLRRRIQPAHPARAS